MHAKEGLLQNPSEPFLEGKFQDFFEQIPKYKSTQRLAVSS